MAHLQHLDSESKIISQHDWIEAYFEQGMQYPISLEIDPTNRCPLDCPYCVWDEFRKDNQDTLDPEDLMRVVREASEIGIRSLIWTGGGEPLSNRGTVASIQFARRLGLNCGMFTTGVPMTEQVSEVLVDNLDWIRFHLDGATPESYGASHRVNPKVFDKVTSNIANFTRLRTLKGSSTRAGIGTVALETNIDEAVLLAQLAKSLGLDYFQYKLDLTRMLDLNYLEWWNTVGAPTMQNVALSLEDENFGLHFAINSAYGEVDKSSKCHVHHMHTSVTATGNVAYCKMTRDKTEWALGNIKEASLKEIFDGDKHKQLLAEVTPTTCGILPCPLKGANISIEKVSQSGDMGLLKPKNSGLADQDFL